MDRTARTVVPLGFMAFAFLMAYAVSLQLRIWHVISW